MIKEFSAGGIIYRKEQDKLLFLVIFSARNELWGFPKGHIEQGETEQQAALREIKEETGLESIHLVPGVREEDVYQAISHRGSSRGTCIEKHSIYFLFGTQEAVITVDDREITAFKWLGFEEAKALITFPTLKSILQNAYTSAVSAST